MNAKIVDMGLGVKRLTQPSMPFPTRCRVKCPHCGAIVWEKEIPEDGNLYFSESLKPCPACGIVILQSET